MTPQAFERALLDAMPAVRAWSLRLSRDPEMAEDLLQETMLRAWTARERFQNDNFLAWLQTIARNIFLGWVYKANREPNVDPADAAWMLEAGDPLAPILLRDALDAIDRLSVTVRGSLIAVGIDGMRYEEAAMWEGVPVGTIKSRVNRARLAIAEHRP